MLLILPDWTLARFWLMSQPKSWPYTGQGKIWQGIYSLRKAIDIWQPCFVNICKSFYFSYTSKLDFFLKEKEIE